MISIALHLNGEAMGTLIDPTARIGADGQVVGGSGFARANTPLFAYDTNAVHAGPGVPYVPPPYPQYRTQRVFFLVCSAHLDPSRLRDHRRDNGLRGAAELTIDLTHLLQPNDSGTNKCFKSRLEAELQQAMEAGINLTWTFLTTTILRALRGHEIARSIVRSFEHCGVYSPQRG